ncbi:Protein kinase-like (PK-like) [Glarea lozoyensis ATCC 20868]|uniref:Protein kinase-like (PK-like) n=1 Tax=Glarea lozoyensis (strain ATCC 20868 / MF5171) TaxID=1116229 RepID=S3DU13_GLAL2|nr:Protein kinase-like (PK-like) [Glarea lozoyensis ATCC 20868]EPE35436.1 Protein kinase-like (PK-like) [Glarea lozoyensis ATCC 20868]
MCNTKIFIVTVNVKPENMKTNKLIAKYDQELLADDDESLDFTQFQILNILDEAGWEIFATIAPTVEKGSQQPSQDLYASLNSEKFYFEYHEDNGHASIRSKPSQPRFAKDLKLNNFLHLPHYSVKEVVVLEKIFAGLGYIAKVSLNGQEMCCKCVKPDTIKAVQREYECLQKVAMSKVAPGVRTPKLLGFVTDDSGDVVGILETFIPHKQNLSKIEGGINGIPEAQRREWARQIKDTMETLHNIDVIWGDAKAQNVLIHSETNACYLVDFEGSWTNGWVDENLKETRQGDEQGLKRIIQYLGL